MSATAPASIIGGERQCFTSPGDSHSEGLMRLRLVPSPDAVTSECRRVSGQF